MEIKKIQNADVEGKKVLLRVDFNVAIEEDTVKEKFKVQAAEETVRYLLGMNAKVALISHLGRPEGKVDPQFSLNPIKDDIEYILGHKVKFVSDCVGEEVKKTVDSLGEGEIALFENVRFFREKKAMMKNLPSSWQMVLIFLLTMLSPYLIEIKLP
jgi:phosphoglycerate kinase